jgi:hypothetical protein
MGGWHKDKNGPYECRWSRNKCKTVTEAIKGQKQQRDVAAAEAQRNVVVKKAQP